MNQFRTGNYVWAIAKVVPDIGEVYMPHDPRSIAVGNHPVADFSGDGKYQPPQKVRGTPHFLVAPADLGSDPKAFYLTLTELLVQLCKRGTNLLEIYKELNGCNDIRVGPFTWCRWH